jgi:hypothetical protein
MRTACLSAVVLAACSTSPLSARDDAAVPDLWVSFDSAPPPPDLTAPLPDLTVLPDLRHPGADGGQSPGSDVVCGTNGPVCTQPKGLCCKPSQFAKGTCVASDGACAGNDQAYYCDDGRDCAGNQVCCLEQSGGSACVPPADCHQQGDRIACVVDGDCPMGQNCCGVGPSPNYYCSAGPCPISLRRYKADIRYLEPADVARLGAEILAYPLTTFRYQGDPGFTPHLGFIIDDVAPSPAVAPDGQTVDLYGYATMAVAALQAQQRQLAALEARVRALEAQRSGVVGGVATSASTRRRTDGGGGRKNAP